MSRSDPGPQKSMGLHCTHCHYPIVKVLSAGSRKEPGATQGQTNAPDGFIRDVKPAKQWAGSS